jgi:Holliday junction resolvase RusA-like endonuclease
MPKKYMQWRQSFVRQARMLCHETIDVPFAMSVIFSTETGKMKPDRDNAKGAILDALQDAGIIANDRLYVSDLFGFIRKMEKNEIGPAIKIALVPWGEVSITQQCPTLEKP